MKRTEPLKEFEVDCQITYNGVARVSAANEDEAIKKVEKKLNYNHGDGFPDSAIFGGVDFVFGQATADYANSVDEESNTASPASKRKPKKKHAYVAYLTVQIEYESDRELDGDDLQELVGNLDYNFISQTNGIEITETEISDIQD